MMTPYDDAEMLGVVADLHFESDEVHGFVFSLQTL
jgi:hypothetical protein